MSTATLLDRIGVGIDTARYGHRASFLRPDRQPAAKPLTVLESRAGYRALQERLEPISSDRRSPLLFLRLKVSAFFPSYHRMAVSGTSSVFNVGSRYQAADEYRQWAGVIVQVVELLPPEVFRRDRLGVAAGLPEAPFPVRRRLLAKHLSEAGGAVLIAPVA